MKDLPPKSKKKKLKKADKKAPPALKRSKEESEKVLKKNQKDLEIVNKAVKKISKDMIDDDFSVLEDYQEEVEILWKPHEGPQTEFLKANEDEVLFAGGRGSGKSDCLIIDPLRFCNNKNFRGLVIRRTMPELRELIGRAKELYPKVYKGAKWRTQENSFVFPSGARIDFGYCDSEDDVERYRGQQYTWLGIDEITQYTDENILERLKGSLRTTDPTLKIYIRASCNPTGPGRGWVKERWIDHDPLGGNRVEIIPEGLDMDVMKQFGDHTLNDLIITRRWFNSTVNDNPSLMQDPKYLAQLASLPEVLREQWLYGSWDAVEGLAFPEFDRTTHVVEEFDIPHNWYKFRACDYGYSSMGVCLWMAVDWDNNIFVYREHASTGETADIFARSILSKERFDDISIGYLDGSCFAKRGEIGESAGETMLREGANFIPADRSPGSRKNGKIMVHNYLRLRDSVGVDGLPKEAPKLFIFDSCKELIKELGTLMLDPNDPEDIDKSKKSSTPDHAYDALRYGLMSRPDVNRPIGPSGMGLGGRVREDMPAPVDNIFGY